MLAGRPGPLLQDQSLPASQQHLWLYWLEASFLAAKGTQLGQKIVYPLRELRNTRRTKAKVLG